MNKTQLATVGVIVGILAGVLISPRRTPTTPDHVHQWSNWTNSWPGVNDFGNMMQHRFCTNCGWYDKSVHQ